MGQWMKALKAVVGGLKHSERPVRTPGLQDAGRVPPHGAPRIPEGSRYSHEFTRINRPWMWQKGYHDHKFRTPESEARKWEYICLNPVRASLVKRPEDWRFSGEIFYDEAGGPRLVRGTPSLLEIGILIQEPPPAR